MQKWLYKTGTTVCFEDVADAYVDAVCNLGIYLVYGKDGDACKVIKGVYARHVCSEF